MGLCIFIYGDRRFNSLKNLRDYLCFVTDYTNDNTKGMLHEDSSILERYAVSAGNILISSAQSLVLGPMVVKMKVV